MEDGGALSFQTVAKRYQRVEKLKNDVEAAVGEEERRFLQKAAGRN